MKLMNKLTQILKNTLASLFFLGLSNAAWAQTQANGCDSDMPCIGEAVGLLSDNDKAKEAIATVNWGFGAVALAIGVSLAIHAAVKFKDQRYAQGVSSAGGVIVMMVIFILIKNKLLG
jgi:hypothetical protein